MKQPLLRFWLFNSSILFYLLHSNATTAQIVPDATLPVNSSVMQQGNTSIIEGGTTAGTNLFHSFKDFSVPNGAEAFFNNALEIQNIFSRVTGGNISNINGLIRANGVANLFLINPNGIIFGPNARLNIGGSFLASTASSIRFADGMEFSATNTNAPPLLTINVPIGLQYGKNAGNIQVQGKGQEFGLDGATESFGSELNPLEVLPGKTLAIAGGNVIIDGGILQAPGGRVELGAIAGEGRIGLNADGSLSFPDGVARADVSIINKAGINVLAAGGGSIAIAARNIDISGESLLTGGIATGQGTPESMAGDIKLSALEVITIASSLINNNVNPDAVGNSGNVSITTKSMSVTNGAVLDATTYGQGKAGSVTIIASDTVSFDGETKDGSLPSGAVSAVAPNAVGDAGGVSITTKSLSVTNGAQLNASSFGQGQAGSVMIIASDTVSFDGETKNGNPSKAYSAVAPNAVGDAGGVSITTESLSVTNGAVLDASTFGQGKAGSVTIIASDTVSFDGERQDRSFPSGAVSGVAPNGVGDAGGVSITTKFLSVTNGAQLNASTFGQGKAGSVTIIASDTVSFDGQGKDGKFSSAAASGVGPNGVGDAGGVSITTKSLSVTNGAVLDATTLGQGKAGSVTIIASNKISFDGVSKDGFASAAASRVGENAVGDAGGVSVTTKSLSVTNGAVLSASTFGQGKAGSVTIIASNKISFDGVTKDGKPSGAFSTVGSKAVGDAGGVSITAKSLSVTNGTELSSSSSGKGAAGNIIVESDSILLDNRGEISTETIEGLNPTGKEQASIRLSASSLILRRGSSITTNAEGENLIGGNITINAYVLAALENSDISANSINSKGGNVTINAEAIFGAQSRTREELQSLLNTSDTVLLDPINLPSSDITATGANSALSGTLAINTPDVDPSSGLIELPVDFVDPTRLIVQGCPSNRGNSFTVTGRGGLPPSPNDPLRANNTVSPSWVTRDSSSRGAEEQVSGGAGEIIEATGWIVNEKGQVELIASKPNTTHNGFLLIPSSCPETVEAR